MQGGSKIQYEPMDIPADGSGGKSAKGSKGGKGRKLRLSDNCSLLIPEVLEPFRNFLVLLYHLLFQLPQCSFPLVQLSVACAKRLILGLEMLSDGTYIGLLPATCISTLTLRRWSKYLDVLDFPFPQSSAKWW